MIYWFLFAGFVLLNVAAFWHIGLRPVPGRGYSVRIIADAVSPGGHRLTTWELRYPEMVHAELMTHRLFSRNAASSRAVPTRNILRQVLVVPALPVWWGRNQAGMQAREELTGLRRTVTIWYWCVTRLFAVLRALVLCKLGLHKQLANRHLFQWKFITVIVSATDFDGWFALRDHPAAQPEIAWIAREMRWQYRAKQPTRVEAGYWHLPYVSGSETVALGIEAAKKVSVGRCARVSYLTHDGRRDPEEDVKLYEKLVAAEPPHMSPFEHVAVALPGDERSGNFTGWGQLRKTIPNEHAGMVRT